MDDSKRQNRFKKHSGIFIILALVIIIGLAAVIVLLATKKPAAAKNQATSQQQNASTTSTSAYKLAACKAGTSQTIGNASYVVGTDIAPGNYKIVSQPAGTDWTNINIYNSKAKYIKEGSPSVEQGVPDVSLSPQNNESTNTKLSDGQFMQVDADPATFTCE